MLHLVARLPKGLLDPALHRVHVVIIVVICIVIRVLGLFIDHRRRVPAATNPVRAR